MSCEFCKKAFATKQELVRHSKKGCKFGNISKNIKKQQIIKPSPLKFGEFGCVICDKKFSSKDLIKKHYTSFHPKEPFSFKTISVVNCNVRQFSYESCKKAFASKQEMVSHSEKGCKFDTSRGLITQGRYCGILCSKCNLLFCSQDSLELHFNSCEGSEIAMQAEKLPIADRFSCSKCDIDFDLREILEEHSANCEIAMPQPGEEHLDHTYSKSFSKFELNKVKMEVKEERFENFETHQQVGIDHITSKDFDRPFIKSESFRMKTEFKAEEEAFEEFDTHKSLTSRLEWISSLVIILIRSKVISKKK